MDQPDAERAGIFSRLTNRTREATSYAIGELRHVAVKRAEASALGLDADTAELTMKTLSNRLVTLERTRFSHRFCTDTTYVRVQP
eukprot:2828046-Pyramimonas_sp.AAC.1